MQRKCLKCGETNRHASGDVLEACPGCGAIYSRVEAACGVGATVGRAARPDVQAGAESPMPPQWAPPARERSQGESVERFADRMRMASLYPTFRGLVQLLYWVTVALAVTLFAFGLIGVWKLEGAQSASALFFGVFFGILALVVARVTREMSLMLADLADAAVRLASREGA